MNTFPLLPVRSPKNFLTCLIGLMTLLLATNAPAHHRPGHSGGPGGDDGGDPPAECTDLFPSFVYVREGGRNSADVTYLASEDGCRSVPLPGVVGSIVHMTDVLADGPDQGSVKGVIVWAEDPENLNQYQMRRADFTVDSEGNVKPEGIQTLDLGVDGGLFPDLWGNSAHTELYLVSTGNGGLWIYNLNDLTDKRELYQSAQLDGSWVCPEGTLNPEAVAGCYRPVVSQWNPTGTALYIQDTLYSPDLIPTSESVRWNATVRLRISRVGTLKCVETQVCWDISPPKIVFTAPDTNTGNVPGGGDAKPRHGEFSCNISPEPCDLILVDGGMLDVEQCVLLFNPPAAWPPVGPEPWRGCLVGEDPYANDDPFDIGNNDVSGRSWQSPDHILHTVREKRRKTSIFRTNIHDGVSTKLIDNAESPDGGK